MVEILTEHGPEMRKFKIRAQPDDEDTMRLEAESYVKKLGFVTTGRVEL